MKQDSDPSLIETIAQPLGSEPASAPEVAAVAVALAAAPSVSSSSGTIDEGRFLPGTLLAGRYRVIGLLGRGGMGEVYRATDLTLGQSVALKFLPEAAARDSRLLERFHGEVRVARQVSHPNVCRVYDIGQIDEMPFISMEYVDGEDLSSLLLRIGRLPAAKALETARKLCAGLAAAHDRGIIHRDLKPQNIMLNKRGEVLIMDFGLAAVADQLSGQEVRNGTPAYMAPEQLKGAEVTARSDIYSLGLVLYELFTGKRPYEAKSIRELIDLQESGHLTSVTSLASDVDPAVEKVIRRCLEPDPARRPVTPLSVSAALPGGDPLAAALAAGETPSPEMVAAAGKVEGMERKFSIPLLAVTALCLFASIPIHQHFRAVLHSPLDIPPQALKLKAREIAAAAGYTARPADSFLSLSSRGALVNSLAKLPEPRQWDQWLAAESPLAATYREGPSLFIANPAGEVTADNPAPTEPGMVSVQLDGGARLRSFDAVPLPDKGAAAVAPETLFRAAGLDPTDFSEKTPDVTPRYATDQLRAWSGPHPKIPTATVNAAIGWWRGRVTFARFEVEFPQSKAIAGGASSGGWFKEALPFVLAFAIGIGLFFAALLARHNWRLSRGDRKGALRLAVAVIVLSALQWLGRVHPIPELGICKLLFGAAGSWLLSGFAVWLLYLALEPALRARWPHSIVSWNRILIGKWLDPQVGSHVLIGAAVGTSLWTMINLVQIWTSPANTLDGGFSLRAALGTRQWLGTTAEILSGALFVGLIAFFTIFGLRALFKRDWAAATAAAFLFTLAQQNIWDSDMLAVSLTIYVILFAALIFVLLRFGLVATIAAVFFINSYSFITVGQDWSAWTAPSGLATLTFLLGLGVFAFWSSLGTRDLIGAEEDGVR